MYSGRTKVIASTPFQTIGPGLVAQIVADEIHVASVNESVDATLQNILLFNSCSRKLLVVCILPVDEPFDGDNFGSNSCSEMDSQVEPTGVLTKYSASRHFGLVEYTAATTNTPWYGI